MGHTTYLNTNSCIILFVMMPWYMLFITIILLYIIIILKKPQFSRRQKTCLDKNHMKSQNYIGDSFVGNHVLTQLQVCKKILDRRPREVTVPYVIKSCNLWCTENCARSGLINLFREYILPKYLIKNKVFHFTIDNIVALLASNFVSNTIIIPMK